MVVGRRGGPPAGLNLLAHVPEMVTISDRDGRIVYANPATERVSGFAPEEFASLAPFSRMHPEDRPRCEEAFAELLCNAGLSLRLEHRVRHKDGSWRWVEVTFASLFENPEVGGLLATVRDVTDRKRRELNVALLDEVGKDLSVLSAPDEIIRMVGTRLGGFLQASGCIFADVDEANNEATIHHGWNTADVPSLKQTFRLADYFGEEFRRAGRLGETVVVRDTARDERANAEAYAQLKLGGFVTVPFQRHGRWTANITVTSREPRNWRADEIELLQEIASRVFPRIERARAEAALSESEEKYRTLFASIDEGFCVVDLVHDDAGEVVDYRFVEVNRVFERQTGVENPTGRTDRELGLNTEPHWLERYDEVARTGEPLRVENYHESTGSWYEAYVSRVGGDGSRRVAIVFENVTERKRAEAALRESEESLRLAVDAASLGRWEYSIRGEELRGYAAFNEHHRAAPDADLGMEEHLEAIHPADREAVRERVARAVEEGGEYEVEYRVPRPDGTTRWILSRGRFIGGEDPTSDRLVGVTMDVTERRELEEQKEKARARALSSRAEAAERERIGRELHDRVAHTMGMAHQSLELYSALAQSAPERAREKLGLAKEATRTALDETRDLSAQLARRQTEETQDGLTSALRELLRSHLPDGVEGDLRTEGDEKALPPIVKEQAYLVMREAVRNAVTHSGCQRVGVIVEVDGGELRGRVEDDGEGFDHGEIPDGRNTDGEDGNRAEGVGLRSMKERAELLGGRLEISSKPGGGTAVEVRLPLTD